MSLKSTKGQSDDLMAECHSVVAVLLTPAPIEHSLFTRNEARTSLCDLFHSFARKNRKLRKDQ